MFAVKRRTAVLVPVLLALIASAGVLSACTTASTSTPIPVHTFKLPAATATTTATPSPKQTPKATPKVVAKAKPTAKATPKSTAKATPSPVTSPVAPKPAATKTYPNIARGTLAWNGHGCLYKWSGSSWQSKGMCRTTLNGPRDYTYTDSAGHDLFTANTEPASALVWWTDSKLAYQQITNSATHSYQNGTFTKFGLQQASLGNGALALEDFFSQTDLLYSFQQAHPKADLSRATRDIQWIVFKNTWYPAIAARNCRTIDLCP